MAQKIFSKAEQQNKKPETHGEILLERMEMLIQTSGICWQLSAT